MYIYTIFPGQAQMAEFLCCWQRKNRRSKEEQEEEEQSALSSPFSPFSPFPQLIAGTPPSSICCPTLPSNGVAAGPRQPYKAPPPQALRCASRRRGEGGGDGDGGSAQAAVCGGGHDDGGGGRGGGRHDGGRRGPPLGCVRRECRKQGLWCEHHRGGGCFTQALHTFTYCTRIGGIMYGRPQSCEFVFLNIFVLLCNKLKLAKQRIFYPSVELQFSPKQHPLPGPRGGGTRSCTNPKLSHLSSEVITNQKLSHLGKSLHTSATQINPP